MPRIFYAPIFDISDPTLDLGNLTIADGVHTSVVIALGSLRANGGTAKYANSPLFFHSAHANFLVEKQDGTYAEVLPELARQALIYVLSSEFINQATANSWTSPLNTGALWSSTTGFYTIGYVGGAGVNISLTWSTPNGRRLFGYDGIGESGLQTHVGSQVPWFLIKPTMRGVSNPSRDREPGPVGTFAISDSGDVGYGNARIGSEVHRDWTQQFEPIEKCEPINAAADHPFTHRDLNNHCRKGYPFAVLDGGFGNPANEIFNLRSEGTGWEPGWAVPNRTHIANIPYKAIVRGAIGSVA